MIVGIINIYREEMNDRLAATASASQVKEKIYQGSSKSCEITVLLLQIFLRDLL